jgi:predicted  nucleic acid-binding Zn-ribbon protein
MEDGQESLVIFFVLFVSFVVNSPENDTMSGPAAILREIHRLKRNIKDLQSEIERLPRLLKGQLAKVARQEDTSREAQDTIKHLKVKVHGDEVLLKQAQQQIAKHEKQLNEAGSKKEYDALKAEITAERKKCQELEDEILNGMMEIEERTARLPEAEKAVAQAKAEAAEYEKNAKVREANLTEQLAQAQKQLQEVEATLPEDVRPQYQRLAAARGEDALAAAQGRTCMACYTEITAQAATDLARGQFLLCKSCGRILYAQE